LKQSIAMTMQEQKKSIFRSESWRRYLMRQEASVFPRLVTPRNFVILWGLLTAVLAISLWILLKETPVYTRGAAIAVKSDERAIGENIFAVLTGDRPHAFQPGNAGAIELIENYAAITGTITEVENEQIGLAEAVSRFGLTGEACSVIQFPASVVFLRIPDVGHDMFRHENRTNVYKAQVQRGTQRAITYVISATTR
jgi:hypothetical protein